MLAPPSSCSPSACGAGGDDGPGVDVGRPNRRGQAGDTAGLQPQRRRGARPGPRLCGLRLRPAPRHGQGAVLLRHPHRGRALAGAGARPGRRAVPALGRRPHLHLPAPPRRPVRLAGRPRGPGRGLRLRGRAPARPRAAPLPQPLRAADPRGRRLRRRQGQHDLGHAGRTATPSGSPSTSRPATSPASSPCRSSRRCPRSTPPKYEPGEEYGRHLIASGPYKLKRYTPGRLIELVRNENWDPRTDPLRSAWVDKVSVTIGRSETEIQQAIEDGEADLNLDAVPPPVGDLQRLSDDPALARRLAVETTGCVHYLTLQMDAGPTKSLAVRQAVNYAIDRQAVVLAIGGRYAGEPASTVLSPTLAGYSAFDLYPVPGRHRRPRQGPGAAGQGRLSRRRDADLCRPGLGRSGRPCTRRCGRRWPGPGSGSSPPSTTGSTSTRSRCACGPSATSTTWARPAGARTCPATAPARSASSSTAA